MINSFLFFVVFILVGLVLFLSCFTFIKIQSPVSKIIISGFIFILLICTSIVLTIIYKYDISAFIDIAVIYFILGFSSFVLYFVFFNKRT